jgi:isocitrate/isopropylmalate dehydrogenase
MNAPVQQFNPAEVPISYTLNFHQVNVLLKGMNKLMREETEGFYEGFKGHALQTLQAAEVAHKEAAEKAAEKAAQQRFADKFADESATPAPVAPATELTP